MTVSFFCALAIKSNFRTVDRTLEQGDDLLAYVLCIVRTKEWFRTKGLCYQPSGSFGKNRCESS